MGNKTSCNCLRVCHKTPGRRARRMPTQDIERYEAAPEETDVDNERANHLQHISDREKGIEGEFSLFRSTRLVATRAVNWQLMDQQILTVHK